MQLIYSSAIRAKYICCMNKTHLHISQRHRDHVRKSVGNIIGILIVVAMLYIALL